MRTVISIALVLSLSGLAATTRAEDPLLIAIDELTDAGRCVEALTLLDHARGSRASLSGRRALCEARLGRTDDATAHIAEALRATEDAWVASHREALLGALVERPATNEVTAVEPPAPEPPAAPMPALANPYRFAEDVAGTGAVSARATGDEHAPNPYLYGAVEHTVRIPVPDAYEETEIAPNPYRAQRALDDGAALAANPYYYDR